MEFAVHLVTDAAIDPDDEDTWDTLIDLLSNAPHHASLAAPCGKLSAQMTAKADSMFGAGIDAGRVLTQALHQANLRGSIVSAELLTDEEFNRRLDSPPATEDLVSTAEAAETLGISKQRVMQLCKEHHEFPQPAQLGTRGDYYWSRQALKRYLREARRSAGRPKATQSHEHEAV